MARKTNRLFTIGYEQTPAKAVLDELEQAGVKRYRCARRRRVPPPRHRRANAAGPMSAVLLCSSGLGTPKTARRRAQRRSTRYTKSTRNV